MPALVSTLQVMAGSHDVSPLLRFLLPHLIHAVFTCSSGENWNHTMRDWRVDSCSFITDSCLFTCHR